MLSSKMKRLLIIDYRKTYNYNYANLGNGVSEVLEHLDANYGICPYHQYDSDIDIFYDMHYPYIRFISYDPCLLTKFILDCSDVIVSIAQEKFVYE